MAGASTRLRVRVTAGARRSEIVGRYGDAWKVRVAPAPERGRANAALLELLSRELGVGSSELSIVAGHAAQDKVVELRGISAAEIAARLEQSRAD
jgi:uncharacterized protein YggU (UPF0235/DUF167 family)